MRYVLRSLIILSILTFFNPVSPKTVAAQSAPVPQVVSGKTIPCPMPLPATEIDGETIICGQIEVPENWDDPNSPLITLTYARQVSKNLSPIADPIIFFAGGPGGSVLSAQGSAGFDFSYLRETRDVIVWDQRGNRYSSDLSCPPEVQVPDVEAKDAAIGALGEPSFSLASDPQEVLNFSHEFFVIAGFESCTSYFASEGRDISQYNTPNTARDAIALMGHLGYPAYNLFGISYGTQVALEIMEYYDNHPDSELPPIRSAVIDGVFPRNLTGAEDSLVAPYNILRVFSDCEADTACSAAYPNIYQRFIDLLATLEAAPVTDAAGIEVSLDNVLEVLYTAISAQRSLIPYLPRMVDELTRGETTTYQAVNGLITGEVQPLAVASVPSANPLEPFAIEATAVAAELRLLADRLTTLGDTTSDFAQAIEEAQTLPELFAGILNQYLNSSSPDERDNYASRMLDFYIAYPNQQTQQGLLSLATNFPTAVAGELTAVVNLMNEVEVRTTWELLSDTDKLQSYQLLDKFTNMIVKCNDRGTTYKPVEGFEFLRNFEAPQLITEFSIFSNYEAACEIFGLSQPAFAVPTAVSTNYPILVMNGGVDHATPIEWAEVAYSTLTNAQLVLVPMTEHGTTRYSKCTKDIANTFFMYPDAELQTSCVNAFRTIFVLPEDTLPGAAE